MWWLLPPEIWSQILALLPGPSLCSVSLVSRYFRELTKDPALWRHVNISRETIQRLGLQALLDNQRLVRVARLDLSYLDLSEASLESLVRLGERFEALFLRIKHILSFYSRYNQLRCNANPILRYCNLTQDQLSCLLNTLASSSTSSSLTILSLDSISLSSIPVESLTRAVTGREVINLNNTGLTPPQLSSLLLHSPTSTLQTLVLSGVDMSEVPPDLLQLAVETVRHLDLGNTFLSPSHIKAVLTEVIWSNQIEELELTGADLDTNSVSPQLLTDSLACLNYINLTSTSLSRQTVSTDKLGRICRISRTDLRSQLVSVLLSPTQDWSSLSQLNLSTLDLTSLPSALLASATASLTSLRMNYSKLSTEQLTAVVRSLVRGDRVETLEITRQDLSQLAVKDCRKLTRVRTLSSLQCNYCSMTAEITQVYYTELIRPGSALRKVGLVRCDLTRVPTSTLISAMNSLTSLNINYCKLTQQQRAAIK